MGIKLTMRLSLAATIFLCFALAGADTAWSGKPGQQPDDKSNQPAPAEQNPPTTQSPPTANDQSEPKPESPAAKDEPSQQPSVPAVTPQSIPTSEQQGQMESATPAEPKTPAKPSSTKPKSKQASSKKSAKSNNPATTQAPASKTSAEKSDPDSTTSTKKVVVYGSTSEPEVKLAPRISDQQQTVQKQKISDLLGKTDAALHQIAGRQLSSSEDETVKQIRAYMDQAKQASELGDLQRAENLASKAHLLSDELIGK